MEEMHNKKMWLTGFLWQNALMMKDFIRMSVL
jgi:hypothetical protein